MHRKLTDEELQQANGNSPTFQPRNMKCAKCGVDFLADNPKLLPFCSLRCQQMDLAGWLDEEYGLPFEGDKSGQVVEFHDEEIE